MSVELEPFRALDGLRYWYRGPYALVVGVYHAHPTAGARGAIQVRDCNTGQIELKLTVNLVHAELGVGEFVTKWATDDGALVPSVLSTHLGCCLVLGLFEDTGRRVGSGFVDAYGAVFRFARCADAGHEGVGDYVVGCLDCRARTNEIYDQRITTAEATDAVARLAAIGEERRRR